MVKIISNREYNSLQKTKLRLEVEVEKAKEDFDREKQIYVEQLEEEYKSRKLALDKDYTSKMHDMRVKCKEDIEKVKKIELGKREILEKELTKVLIEGIAKLDKKLSKK
jgi:hypothetical protein